MSAPKKSLRVLVVDDEPLISMGVVDMLEDLGHQALSAASAPEALAIVRAQPAIDLLITDQAMPGMTGTQLARECLNLCPDLTVFLSTGFSDLNGEADRSLPRLNKPYSQADLAELIAAKFQIG
ncbi:MAG TPA: response regulator [Dongiaceae bacterium]